MVFCNFSKGIRGWFRDDHKMLLAVFYIKMLQTRQQLKKSFNGRARFGNGQNACVFGVNGFEQPFEGMGINIINKMEARRA